MEFKQLNIHALITEDVDQRERIMIIALSDTTKKVLQDKLDNIGVWNRDLFKRQVQGEGHHLEYLNITTY